jgi:hypothetical protein
MSSIPQVSTVITSSNRATVTINMGYYVWCTPDEGLNITPINVAFPLINPILSSIIEYSIDLIIGDRTQNINSHIDKTVFDGYINDYGFTGGLVSPGDNYSIPYFNPVKPIELRDINTIIFKNSSTNRNIIEINNLSLKMNVNYTSILPPIIIPTTTPSYVPTYVPTKNPANSLSVLTVVSIVSIVSGCIVFIILIIYLAYKLTKSPNKNLEPQKKPINPLLDGSLRPIRRNVKSSNNIKYLK